MKKNVDINLLQEIIKLEKFTQEQFGNSLGYSKQYIWSILKGERKISTEFVDRLSKTYSQYVDGDNHALNLVEIPFCPDVLIPFSNSLKSTSNSKVSFDKRLFPTFPNINFAKCKIVTVAVDSMNPVIRQNDRVIIDESYTGFINDQVFLFTYGNISYIRRINILPDKIKCISLDEKEDTFYLYGMDKVEVLGLIVPQIRL